MAAVSAGRVGKLNTRVFHEPMGHAWPIEGAGHWPGTDLPPVAYEQS
jgi:hypothetical protein